MPITKGARSSQARCEQTTSHADMLCSKQVSVTGGTELFKSMMLTRKFCAKAGDVQYFIRARGIECKELSEIEEDKSGAPRK
ncbi:hypothetical protein [Bradyrhizobium sp. CCBAU 65884]|uniref:hypothetical protein n=1 Tax=Bradyrhizobium sp. CCBAU 65884 TaxID=722477 RepID=UPI002304DA14|nr:hypothetical protein [Bradyrhizobium sp. CCBAU 65884]